MFYVLRHNYVLDTGMRPYTRKIVLLTAAVTAVRSEESVATVTTALDCCSGQTRHDSTRCVDLEVPSTRRTINKPLIGGSRTNWSVAGNLLPFALRGQRYINSEMNKHRDEILIIGNPFDVCLFLQIMNALRAVCRLPVYSVWCE